MYFKLTSILFFCVITSFNARAQKTPELILTPEVCMVQNSDDACNVEVSLSWSLEAAQDVCIMLAQTPLKCWQNSAAGQFSYKAEVQFQTVYSLVNRKTGDVLATAKVAIQSSNTKSQRRRLRTPWSFF